MLLATPLKLKNLTLKNRIVMPPMATHSSKDGSLPKELIAYYSARSEAGTGLIITEHSYIDVTGRADPNQLSLAEDKVIEALKELTSKVHTQGQSLIIAQINHAGSQTSSYITNSELLSASPVAHPALKDGEIPKALTEAEIASFTQKFAEAARRVQQAGFDGVEIHAAHGYLLNQFYSPLTNQREDAYGASLENRLRFLLEVLAAVRSKVGPAFPIAVRLGGADYLEGGSTIEDSVKASCLLEKAGADLLDISGGMCRYTRPQHTEPGWFSDMSSAIKKAVSIPVISRGRQHLRHRRELADHP
ncbi:MAG: NADH:flavin oxidoreductase [Desulfovibrionaceae bacterium]|nr:NADH:flavin oxidoreductase [Desulfovibrionaceae bacterium]